MNNEKNNKEDDDIETYDLLITSIFHSFKFPIEYLNISFMKENNEPIIDEYKTKHSSNNVNIIHSDDKKIKEDKNVNMNEDEDDDKNEVNISLRDTLKNRNTKNKKVFHLKNTVINDLEICNTIDELNNPHSIYDYLYDQMHNKEDIYFNKYKKKYYEMFSNKYTTDIDFLKDYQTYFKHNVFLEKSHTTDTSTHNMSLTISVTKIWNEIRFNKYFKETYYYIEWSYFEFMNRSETYLQVINTLNLVSPIISVLSPLLIFITPFYIFRSLGIKMTIDSYIVALKYIIHTQFINIKKLFSNNVGIKEKTYIIMSFAYYIYVTYNNIMNYFNFNKKMSRIYEYFNTINQFLHSIKNQMKFYIENIISVYLNKNTHVCNNYDESYISSIINEYLLKPNSYKEQWTSSKSHDEFNKSIIDNYDKTIKWCENIENIKEKWSLYKIKELGKVMCEFYKYHYSEEYNNHILYLLGLSGYFNFMKNVNILYLNGQINACSFNSYSNNDGVVSNKNNSTNSIGKNKLLKEKRLKNYTVIYDNYYAPLISQNKIIKNNVKLRKNLIISGPNASGKTTIMKSVLINIILSQQLGIGFYNPKTKITPIDYFHCYLNIPDTSGRDSLFQAEARRCKEIIDELNLKENKGKNHFIIFDELFSGTNPTDAVDTSLSLINYLQNKHNIKFMLTTHYHQICKKAKQFTNIKNKMMDIKKLNHNSSYKNNDKNQTYKENDQKIIYTYKMIDGISTERAGFNVLQEMGFPKEIINMPSAASG